MDSDLLYDEFGNYIGPELASDDSEGSEGSDSGSESGRRNLQDDDEDMGDEEGLDDDQVI
jgi:hypothetical protein